MSEKAKKVDETVEIVETVNEVKDLALTSEGVNELIKSGNIGDALKSLKPVGFSLTAEYLEMEEGEVARFVVVQHATMTVEDDDHNKKEVPCVLMINEDNKTVKAAQTVLVGSLRGCTVPYPIQVTCLGSQKMAGGRKYTGFEILPLS
jgi:hypothetical protein